jgi:hypothetical protein
LWIPIAAGAAAALVIVSLAALLAQVPGRPASAGTGDADGLLCRPWQINWWRSPVYVSSTWSITGSWATNISAVAAILGIALGAAGTLRTLIAPLDLTVLSASIGGGIVLAPVTYAAFALRPEDSATRRGMCPGSIGGLLGSAWMTVAGGLAEAATAGLMMSSSDSSLVAKVCLCAGLGLGAVTVGIYTIRSVLIYTSFRPSSNLPDESAPSLITSNSSAVL